MLQRSGKGAILLFVGAGFLFLAACSGDSGGRHSLSGTVTYKGQKVHGGLIEFHPKGGESTFTGAPIENGLYVIPAKQGLMPGTYLVRIYWQSGAVFAAEAGGVTPPDPKEMIPAKYNKESNLVRDVKPETTTLDFHLD